MTLVLSLGGEFPVFCFPFLSVDLFRNTNTVLRTEFDHTFCDCPTCIVFGYLGDALSASFATQPAVASDGEMEGVRQGMKILR
jgi:hypothetical protein